MAAFKFSDSCLIVLSWLVNPRRDIRCKTVVVCSASFDWLVEIAWMLSFHSFSLNLSLLLTSLCVAAMISFCRRESASVESS